MLEVLEFIRDILQQPALLLGLVSCVGLVALKKPFYKVMTGTLKPILGYIMLGCGAGFIVTNLDPLGKMIQEGFHITGVVPNNEAIVSVAQQLLGVETMSILVVGLVVNLLIARVLQNLNMYSLQVIIVSLWHVYYLLFWELLV